MLSTDHPEDVLRPTGRAGCNAAIFILIVVAIFGVWILLNVTGGGPSPSLSPSPSASDLALGIRRGEAAISNEAFVRCGICRQSPAYEAPGSGRRSTP